jgi:hypothetical protein
MTENNSQRAALFQKLGRATTRIEAVTKSKTADLDKYDYSYATLESVMVAVDAACATENLAWVQITDVEGDRWTLDTMLIDIDTGYAHTFSGMPGTIKGDPQAMGSANTYYRRYGLSRCSASRNSMTTAAKRIAPKRHRTPERPPRSRSGRRSERGQPKSERCSPTHSRNSSARP